MKIDLTPEQLETVYNIVSEKLERDKSRIDFAEDGLRMNMNFDSNLNSITDILRKRLELSSLVILRNELKKALSHLEGLEYV